MKNQTHQNHACVSHYYLAAQIVGIEENKVPLQGSSLKAKLWKGSKHLSVEFIILSVSSALLVLPGDAPRKAGLALRLAEL